MPKYYPINEEAAKRAKDMNSFSDYQPGSATAGYRAMVDEAYAAAERQKARVDPMYHDKIDALVDRYARKLAENLNERNVIDARVPLSLIHIYGNYHFRFGVWQDAGNLSADQSGPHPRCYAFQPGAWQHRAKLHQVPVCRGDVYKRQEVL